MANDRIKKKNITYIDREGNASEQIHHIQKETEPKESNIVEMSKYSNVGFYLLIPILLGLGIGIFLDSQFHSKPFCTLVGIFSGMISSIYNLYKLVTDENTRNKH